MQSRMPILISIAAAIAAIVLMNLYIADLRQSFEPPRRQVLVARHDVRAGALLAAEDVTPALKVKDSVPKFAIDWAQRGNYIGQKLASEVSEGDYVLATQFGAAAAGAARASEKIDAHSNDRLFTLSLAGEASLEGAIRAEDRIDLLLTYTVLSAAEQAAGAKTGASAQPLTVTVPLLDNVYVVYTGSFGSSPRGQYSSVTLLLTPDQAKLLTWAQNLGKINVLLRNRKNLQPLERTYLSGNQTALKDLARQPVPLDEIVTKRTSTDQSAGSNK